MAMAYGWVGASVFRKHFLHFHQKHVRINAFFVPLCVPSPLIRHLFTSFSFPLDKAFRGKRITVDSIYRFDIHTYSFARSLACLLTFTHSFIIIFHKTIKMNIFEMNIQIEILWNLKFMIICITRMANSLSRSFSFYFIILMSLFRKIAKCSLGS